MGGGLHLYTLPNASSSKREGAGAALSNVNSYEEFRSHWLQQLLYTSAPGFIQEKMYILL